MDGVGTPIIGRPRPLPGHDTPNPAYHPHTLNYEEPVKAYASLSSHRRRIGEDRPVLRFTGDPIPYTVTLNDDGTVSLENSGIL